jgi:hypothetical protein
MAISALVPILLIAAEIAKQPIPCVQHCDFKVPTSERLVSVWTEDWHVAVDTQVSRTAGWRYVRITSSRAAPRTSSVSIITNRKTYVFRIATGISPTAVATTAEIDQP